MSKQTCPKCGKKVDELCLHKGYIQTNTEWICEKCYEKKYGKSEDK